MCFVSNKSKNSKSRNSLNKNRCCIRNAEMYEYLGVMMDKNWNLTKHFEKMIKKASSRVKLFSCVHNNLNPYSAETIYKVMILPLMLYSINIFVGMPASKKQNFENIQQKALALLMENGRTISNYHLLIIIVTNFAQLKSSNV